MPTKNTKPKTYSFQLLQLLPNRDHLILHVSSKKVHEKDGNDQENKHRKCPRPFKYLSEVAERKTSQNGTN